MKNSLIFDFDKTIATIKIDWADWHAGVAQIFRSFDSAFTYVPGAKVHLQQNNFFKIYGQDCRDQVTKFNRHYELERAEGVVPNDKVLKIIHDSPEAIKYVWSSNSNELVEKYLSELGIHSLFKKVIAREEVFFIKPDPEGFYLIHNDEPLEKYVFYGDSEFDRDAAHAIGVTYIDVNKL